MRFRLYNGDELIGYSELEHADDSMGIRMGKFYPAEGYAALEPIYREFSMVRFDEHLSEYQANNPDQLEQLRARRKQLQYIVAGSPLRLETEDGRLIGTAYICIEDSSEELGEQEREITIQVDDHATYEQYFAS
jgi:hypothetical protein